MEKWALLCLTITALLLSVFTPSPVWADELSDAAEAAAAGEAQALSEAAYISAAMAELQAELDVISEQLSEINTQLEETTAAIDAKAQELQDTQYNLMEAQDKQSRQYTDMSLRIKYTYENSLKDTISILLESGSLAEMISRVETISMLNTYDKDKQAELIATRDAIAQHQAQLEAEQAELLALQGALTEEQIAANEQVDLYNATIEGYADEIAMAQAMAAEYAEQLASIEAAQAEIAAAAQASGSETAQASENGDSESGSDDSGSSSYATNNGSYGADASDYELLAHLIYCEAGGEPYEGQVAVGAVVLNRVRSASFPDNIHDVIYQSYQFSPTFDGSLNRAFANGNACYAAADEALAGSDPTGGCLFFRTDNGTAYKLKIGHHIFR